MVCPDQKLHVKAIDRRGGVHKKHLKFLIFCRNEN